LSYLIPRSVPLLDLDLDLDLNRVSTSIEELQVAFIKSSFDLSFGCTVTHLT